MKLALTLCSTIDEGRFQLCSDVTNQLRLNTGKPLCNMGSLGRANLRLVQGPPKKNTRLLLLTLWKKLKFNKALTDRQS